MNSISLVGWLQRFRPFYFYSVAAILLMVASAKIYSALGDVRILGQIDPLFRVNNRTLMLAVAATETAIAVVLLFGHSSAAKTVSVFWLSANFVLYRSALWYLGYKVCPCLGNLTDNLGLSKGKVDVIMRAVLLYLLVGSCAYLYNLVASGRRRTAEDRSLRGKADPASQPVQEAFNPQQ